MKKADIKYLDDYFSGRLSPEEAEKIELRLQQDPAFARQAELYKNVNETLRDKRLVDFYLLIKNIQNNGRYKHKKRNYLLSLVVVFVLICLLILLLLIFAE
jgi:hypothetical protein